MHQGNSRKQGRTSPSCPIQGYYLFFRGQSNDVMDRGAIVWKPIKGHILQRSGTHTQTRKLSSHNSVAFKHTWLILPSEGDQSPTPGTFSFSPELIYAGLLFHSGGDLLNPTRKGLCLIPLFISIFFPLQEQLRCILFFLIKLVINPKAWDLFLMRALDNGIKVSPLYVCNGGLVVSCYIVLPSEKI